MEGITSRLSGLNPLSKRSRRAREDEEDVGEEIDDATVAGGGRQRGATPKSHLRVSHALRSLLVREGMLGEADAGLDEEEETIERRGAALRALLDKPHTAVPPELTDRSHPLPEYFISSSHNTYLLGHQLHGTSSATAYETALNTGSRCVEIDAWDNDDDAEEPKVTHGYTLVSNIPFRAVCETIRDVVDREGAAAAGDGNGRGYGPAPILLSLENHCGPRGQQRLVDIMREVFGDRLLSKAVREEGHAEQEGDPAANVSLAQLGSKIAVIVEYHLPDEVDSSSSDDSDDDDAEEAAAHEQYKAKKKAAAASGGIIPELADLGMYAQSVKPRDGSWYEKVEEGAQALAGAQYPHHHLINVSESGLASHAASSPGAPEKIARHNGQHLMRVFPKGTRISSKNLRPVPFWGLGAQICALNWQTFGAGMQLNEALFSGTDGYVLKPAALRPGGRRAQDEQGAGRRKRLRLRVAGATDVPVPEGKGDDEDDIKPYLTCTLVHPGDLKGEDPPKRKTKPYRPHRLGFLHRENPGRTDPLWDDTLEWEYDDDDELAFLRMLVKSDVSFATNPLFAVAAVRLLYVVPGWSFIRMLDLAGHETGCTLLVKFEIEDLPS